MQFKTNSLSKLYMMIPLSLTILLQQELTQMYSSEFYNIYLDIGYYGKIFINFPLRIYVTDWTQTEY